MEKIIESEAGAISIQVGEGTTVLGQDDAYIIFENEHGYALATALYSRFAEWKPVSEAPLQSGKYWVRFDEEEPFIAYYSARVNKWSYAMTTIQPTHYSPILKPQI